MRNQPSGEWVYQNQKLTNDSPVLHHFFHRLLIPIWTDLGDVSFALKGTAFAVQRNDELFILTAKHVLEEAPKPRIQFGNVFAALEGEVGYPRFTAPDRVHPVDMVMIKPSEKLADRIKSSFTTVPASRLSFAKSETDGPFIIAGFIISQSRFIPAIDSAKGKLFVHQLTVVKKEDGRSELFLPKTRIGGSALPQPQGLSGAPILCILNSNELIIAGLNYSGIVSETGYSLSFVPGPIIRDFLNLDG